MVRDVEIVDTELRFLGVVRRAIQERGGRPSWAAANQLLDERIELMGRDGGQDPEHVRGG